VNVDQPLLRQIESLKIAEVFDDRLLQIGFLAATGRFCQRVEASLDILGSWIASIRASCPVLRLTWPLSLCAKEVCGGRQQDKRTKAQYSAGETLTHDLDRYAFTIGHALSESGRNASSAGVVPISL
jgi:hypothetical protein